MIVHFPMAPGESLVLASPCRETTLSVWPQQGVILVCLFLPAEKGGR